MAISRVLRSTQLLFNFQRGWINCGAEVEICAGLLAGLHQIQQVANEAVQLKTEGDSDAISLLEGVGDLLAR